MTTLTAIGDKLGLLLDRPTLEKLGIDEATPLIVTSDSEGLHIRAARFATSEQVEIAARGRSWMSTPRPCRDWRFEPDLPASRGRPPNQELQLEKDGGLEGVRDPGLLDRP